MNSSTLIRLILLVTLLIMGWVTWRHIRRGPRRLTSTGWIVVALLPSTQILVVLGFSAPLLGLGFLVLMSPLLAIGSAGFPILNGLVTPHRERFSLAHSLSLLIGVEPAATVVACIFVTLIGERRTFPIPTFIMFTTDQVASMSFCPIGHS